MEEINNILGDINNLIRNIQYQYSEEYQSFEQVISNDRNKDIINKIKTKLESIDNKKELIPDLSKIIINYFGQKEKTVMNVARLLQSFGYTEIDNEITDIIKKEIIDSKKAIQEIQSKVLNEMSHSFDKYTSNTLDFDFDVLLDTIVTANNSDRLELLENFLVFIEGLENIDKEARDILQLQLSECSKKDCINEVFLTTFNKHSILNKINIKDNKFQYNSAKKGKADVMMVFKNTTKKYLTRDNSKDKTTEEKYMLLYSEVTNMYRPESEQSQIITHPVRLLNGLDLIKNKENKGLEDIVLEMENYINDKNTIVDMKNIINSPDDIYYYDFSNILIYTLFANSNIDIKGQLQKLFKDYLSNNLLDKSDNNILSTIEYLSKSLYLFSNFGYIMEEYTYEDRRDEIDYNKLPKISKLLDNLSKRIIITTDITNENSVKMTIKRPLIDNNLQDINLEQDNEISYLKEKNNKEISEFIELKNKEKISIKAEDEINLKKMLETDFISEQLRAELFEKLEVFMDFLITNKELLLDDNNSNIAKTLKIIYHYSFPYIANSIGVDDKIKNKLKQINDLVRYAKFYKMIEADIKIEKANDRVVEANDRVVEANDRVVEANDRVVEAFKDKLDYFEGSNNNKILKGILKSFKIDNNKKEYIEIIFENNFEEFILNIRQTFNKMINDKDVEIKNVLTDTISLLTDFTYNSHSIKIILEFVDDIIDNILNSDIKSLLKKTLCGDLINFISKLSKQINIEEIKIILLKEKKKYLNKIQEDKNIHNKVKVDSKNEQIKPIDKK
jgi:hypothetical protein